MFKFRYLRSSLVLSFVGVLSLAFVSYPQLKLLPLSTATQPITPILLALILLPLMARTLFDYGSKVKRFYFSNGLISRWLPFASAVIFVGFSSIFIHGALGGAVKFFLNLFVIFSFYWLGYTKLGLGNRFYKIILFFAIPMFIVGWIEVIGLLVYAPFYGVVDSIRSTILSVNIDRTRLHLLFSEPSFLPVYFIFLLYCLQRLGRRMVQLAYFSIIVFLLMSKSLNTMAILAIFIGGYFFFHPKTTKLKKIFIVFFSFSFIAITIGILFQSRLEYISDDQSTYNRMYHISVMLDMFIKSYGLGQGYGQYSSYFYDYVNKNGMIIPTAELLAYQSGNMKAISGSMFFQIMAEMGVLGVVTFLYLFKFLFKNKCINRHYYLAILVSVFMAMPWGMPYVWLVLGMLDKENDDAFKIKKGLI